MLTDAFTPQERLLVSGTAENAAKAADVVVLCMGPHCSIDQRPFDETGYETLTFLKAQGLPQAVGAYQGVNDATYQPQAFLHTACDADLEAVLEDGLKNCIGVAAAAGTAGTAGAGAGDGMVLAEPLNRRLTATPSEASARASLRRPLPRRR